MIRILGIVVGAFLAASALVLLLGIPEFHRDDAGDANQARMVAAIENAQSRWEEREPPEPVELVEPALTQARPDATPPSAVDTAAPEQPDVSEEPPFVLTQPEWHAIWTPFRTEIAARGFVSRLESVTGLDYRVQKLGKGAWQVAFAYDDATGLDAGLEQIAAATGLDLAAERP